MNIVLLMFALPVLAQSGGTVTVSGVVTSAEDKYPLIGAHVIAGDNNGVSTLLDGSYSIDVKPGDVLTYYYVGYEEVKYTVPDGAASIKHNVELKAETKSLEDVVVIAYGVRQGGVRACGSGTRRRGRVDGALRPLCGTGAAAPARDVAGVGLAACAGQCYAAHSPGGGVGT